MLKNFFIILILCGLSQFSWSQIKNGKIIYIASFNKDIFLEAKDLDKNMLTMVNNSYNVQLELIFIDFQSICAGIKEMESDLKKGFNITANFAGYNNIFYFDKENNYGLKSLAPIDGVNYLMTITSPEWKLTKETKKIGNYLTYKAIQINKNTKFETIAWYAPEIPLSFGPAMYNGLPGLILEVNSPMINFTATKVSLENLKLKQIEKPKGILISEDEFRKKFGSVFNEN